MARALAISVFIKQRFFPLIIDRDDRTKYIDSLEMADKGELLGLVLLFFTSLKTCTYKSYWQGGRYQSCVR